MSSKIIISHRGTTGIQSTIEYIRRYLGILLALLALGCQSITLKVINPNNRMPVAGVAVHQWIEHGDFQDFIMGLPSKKVEANVLITNHDGCVTFKKSWSSNSFIINGGARGMRDEVVYFDEIRDQWFVDGSAGGESIANESNGIIVIPLQSQKSTPCTCR